MKPHLLISLAVTAIYSLSGCSQHPPRMNQPPKAASQNVSYNQTKTQATKKVNRQRYIAPRAQVKKAVPQRRVAALQRRIAPPRPAAVVRRHSAPQQPISQRPHLQMAYQRHIAPPQQYRPAPPRQPMGNGMPSISSGEVRRIGDQIFKNESGGDVNKLVHWNIGEDFASMGIGHFTWYPANRRQSFGNTFPGMLNYLESRGVRLPQWVQQAKHRGAPWRTRAQLRRDKNNPQVQELQRMLYETRYLQAEYIMQRAQRAMPKLVTTAPPHLRPMVAGNLNAVANSRGGWYPLIDYVNFKGEGLSRHGGYKGQNWGLLQVLEEMRPANPGQPALNEFADAAMRVLQRRVQNSPRKRNERRWLSGWNNRVSTYREII